MSPSPDILAAYWYLIKMNSHSHAQHSCHSSSQPTQRRWFQDPLVLTLIGTGVLLLASYPFPFLIRFRYAFYDYVGKIWLPMLLGFVLGGLIDYYVPREYITQYLARPRKRTIFYATGLGFLMSACSHGIIALSMELHKKGASGPAVVSFLLASPWANLPITFLLIGFFGAKAFWIIGGALLISVSTGLIFQILDRYGWIERNRNFVSAPAGFSIGKDIARRWKEYRFSAEGFVQDLKGIGQGIWELSEMVLWWVLLGMVLASLVSAFVPSRIFHQFFGPSVPGLIATLILAAVFEVCSEGTSPLAFELYKRTGAFGNAFAFLMGGVVTDYTEIALIWANLGKKTVFWMLVVTLPQVILLALFLNIFA